jgi:small subunit ribosomal protein S1
MLYRNQRRLPRTGIGRGGAATMKNEPNDALSREISAALEGVNLQAIESGSKPKGRGTMRGVIAGISGDDVFVDLGPRMQGVISLREFDSPPKEGAALDFELAGREDELWKLTRVREKAPIASGFDDLQPGVQVKAKITGQNTGGLEARVGALSAFVPASQVSLGREDNLAQYIGQNMDALVVEVNLERKRVVLSRRALLEKERDVLRQEAVGKYHVGMVVKGRVARVESFGAFVDLGGGLEGLLHVSNLAHRRVEKASELVNVGDNVEVQILSIDEGGKRIGLGRKQLEPDPMDEHAARLVPDSVVAGKVVRVMDFGAFVEIAPGVEGLVHVSQLGKDRVRRASDAVKAGDELQVRILSVDRGQKRIALTRLDPRGALIGSEDSVDAAVIDAALKAAAPRPSGTNLGNLFKAALDKKGKG